MFREHVGNRAGYRAGNTARNTRTRVPALAALLTRSPTPVFALATHPGVGRATPWSRRPSTKFPRTDWRHRVILLASSMTPSSDSSPASTATQTKPVPVDAPPATNIDDEDPQPDEPPKHPSVDDMATLVAEHSDAVYRVALSVTRNPVLAEDVAQDALIKAWQAMPSYRGEAPLRNWILRITHNTAVSALRKRREEIRDPNELPERFTGSSIETQVQNRLAIERFTEALDELDETSRSIVVLRELEGLSYDEICEVLKLSLPTVKTRLLRARRQLANSLEGWRP